MINKWNFIRWEDITTSMSNLSSIDTSVFDNLYQVPILANDTLSFYVNFDTLLSLDTDEWGVSLYDCNFNRVSGDLGLNTDLITAGFRNLYSTFTVPSLPRYDNYYLVIHDQYLNTAYYISNPLRNISSNEATDKTYVVEYSHPANIFNFFYDNVPTFTNKVRLHMTIRHPQPKEDAEGYTLIDGSFKTARSTSGRTKEFVTQWFDEHAHDAFFAMCKHDNIIIDGSTWRRNDNDEYTIEWSDNYKYSEGSIRLDDTAYAISNKMC